MKQRVKRVFSGAIPTLWCIAAKRLAGENPALVSLENDVLRVSLVASDASFTVTDKRQDLTWRQQVTAGFHVARPTVKQSPGVLSAEVAGPGGPYLLSIRLAPGSSHG